MKFKHICNQTDFNNSETENTENSFANTARGEENLVAPTAKIHSLKSRLQRKCLKSAREHSENRRKAHRESRKRKGKYTRSLQTEKQTPGEPQR